MEGACVCLLSKKTIRTLIRGPPMQQSRERNDVEMEGGGRRGVGKGGAYVRGMQDRVHLETSEISLGMLHFAIGAEPRGCKIESGTFEQCRDAGLGDVMSNAIAALLLLHAPSPKASSRNGASSRILPPLHALKCSVCGTMTQEKKTGIGRKKT
jgi:hypothetical protein